MKMSRIQFADGLTAYNLCRLRSISCLLIEGGGETVIDPELLSILVCPDCKNDVELKDNKIVCKGCGRRYPIRDGIPIMLVDESEPPIEKRGAE
jgi:uncharacterized protein YbaR (Trm112 family)